MKNVNKEKSAPFLSNKISNCRRQGLLRLTGFVEALFPTKYLGAPLNPSRLTTRMLDPLIQKVRNKVASWKAKLLSEGGRLVLIHHVLSSMVTHTLVVLPMPSSVINRINFILSMFFWGERNGKSKKK